MGYLKLLKWPGILLPSLFVIISVLQTTVRADDHIPQTIEIPAGIYVTGSSQAEREMAYLLDEKAYGHSITRKNGWYDGEGQNRNIVLPAYRIMRTLVTNAQYAKFIAATGHPPPDVDAGTWASYRLVHPYKRTRRHAWKNGLPPEGRKTHPVVLISHDDARAYARWLSKATGKPWKLPSEEQWEKAARGTQGWAFPWGQVYDPESLNSHDKGPFDTMPVASFPRGNSPFGLTDAAGQVFEWTSTETGKNRFLVKGGSWDDKGCGVCRPAARHSRPAHLKHILVGFRLVIQ